MGSFLAHAGWLAGWLRTLERLQCHAGSPGMGQRKISQGEAPAGLY